MLQTLHELTSFNYVMYAHTNLNRWTAVFADSFPADVALRDEHDDCREHLELSNRIRNHRPFRSFCQSPQSLHSKNIHWKIQSQCLKCKGSQIMQVLELVISRVHSKTRTSPLRFVWATLLQRKVSKSSLTMIFWIWKLTRDVMFFQRLLMP